MDIINAIILGIIQGLTEFLPVSSSGHLEIAKVILGEDKIAEESLLMTVVLHFATALATIIVFRKELSKLFGDLLKLKYNSSHQFSLRVLLSMIPAIVIGLLFSSEIESLFGGSLALVGGMLFITGLLLFLSDKAKNTKKNIGIKDSIIIGFAQAIAILPGISRSGATISAAVLLGVDKKDSARFSFLMVVPLIFGKMIHDLFSGKISASEINFLALFIGFLTALITGVIACKWMILLVQKSQLKYFAFYCFVMGILVISASIFFKI